MTRRLNDHQAFLLVSISVLLSRLPFLTGDLGTDADAYRVAQIALDMARHGTYATSRFPGFPVQEAVFAFLVTINPSLLNLISAVLSGVAAGAFTLFLRRGQVQGGVLLGLALAGTPVVFVHSTTAMDYVWALAAIMGSALFIERKPLTAGMLLGLATGCRFTSILMILPLGLLLWKSTAPARGGR